MKYRDYSLNSVDVDPYSIIVHIVMFNFYRQYLPNDSDVKKCIIYIKFAYKRKVCDKSLFSTAVFTVIFI